MGLFWNWFQSIEVEAWESCNSKGGVIPVLKQVTDPTIPRAIHCVSMSLGDLMEKIHNCAKFTLVLFIEGWNQVSIASNIHEFLYGISASSYPQMFWFPRELNFWAVSTGRETQEQRGKRCWDAGCQGQLGLPQRPANHRVSCIPEMLYVPFHFYSNKNYFICFWIFFFFDRGRSLDIWFSCLVSKHLDFQDIFVLLIFILILLWTESILWFKHSNIFDCVYWQNLWPMVVKCLCDLECESWVLGERVPTGQLGQVRGQCVLMGYLSNLLSNPERCSGLQL